MKFILKIMLPIFFSNVLLGQDVHFSGIDKTKARTMLTVRTWHPTFDMDYPITTVIGEAIYENDSVFTISLQPENAISVMFSVPSPMITIQQDGWLTPGDQLHIILDTTDLERPIAFEGRNSGHYNIHKDYDPFQFLGRPINTFKDFEYYHGLLSHQMDSILESSIQKGDATREFAKMFTTQINAYYYYLLDYYFTSKFDSIQQAKVLTAIARKLHELDSFSAYDDLLSSRIYTLGISSIYRFYRPDSIPDDLKYDMDIQFVLTNFSGKTKDFLLADLSSRFSKSPRIAIGRATYQAQTLDILSHITDTVYRQWATDNLFSFEKLGLPLPENILEEKVLDGEGNETSIGKALGQYKGKRVVMDLWASWCTPCIEEFRLSREFIPDWEEKDIVFFYLSIDDPADYPAMHTLSSEYGFTNSNYVLVDKRTSLLYDYLNIGASGIPRYVLLDKEGNLRWLNMPRPSSREQFELLIDKHTPNTVVVY